MPKINKHNNTPLTLTKITKSHYRKLLLMKIIIMDTCKRLLELIIINS